MYLDRSSNEVLLFMILTEHKSGILYPVWLREVDVLHPVRHHEQVCPADVRPLVLQLTNKSFTATSLTRDSTGCVGVGGHL